MSSGLTIKAEAAKSLLPPFGTYAGTLKYVQLMDEQPNPFKEGELQQQIKLALVVTDVLSVDFEEDEEAAAAAIGEEAWAYANFKMTDEEGNVRYAFTPRAKLRIWAQSIAGRKIQDDEEFNVDEIIGKSVMFKVAPNTKGNPTIGDITGYRRKKPARKRQPEPVDEDEFEEDEEDEVDDF